jgi:hypothetical protein
MKKITAEQKTNIMFAITVLSGILSVWIGTITLSKYYAQKNGGQES